VPGSGVVSVPSPEEGGAAPSEESEPSPGCEVGGSSPVVGVESPDGAPPVGGGGGAVGGGGAGGGGGVGVVSSVEGESPSSQCLCVERPLSQPLCFPGFSGGGPAWPLGGFAITSASAATPGARRTSRRSERAAVTS
jgi:hypothetical protein